MENLEKALAIVKSSDYQVSNLEKFSYLYFYLNSLKKKVEEVEKQVRRKGSELMENEDLKSLNYEDYEIKRVESTETEQYRARSVVDALGIDRAMALMKVDGYITTYLKKASAMGAITMDEVEKCRIGIIKKPRAGYLKIQRKKI